MNDNEFIMEMKPYLHKMIENQASDLYLAVGVPPCVKVNGEIVALSDKQFFEKEVNNAVFSLMNDAQKKEFSMTNECNFAFGVKGLGRFRVSAFMQRGQIGCVIRYIQTKIPTLEELNLPPTVKALAMAKKGLILVVGPTGTGKTTTLASMIDCHNKLTKGHILTIEDPIEYLHSHHKCIVTQREVGIDTASFSIALKNAMHQAPDVILIGEIRDSETMRHAIGFAETGHLCLATLHANSTIQALERISHYYPEEHRDQLWMDLSLNLRGILAQRLVRHVNGKCRVVAMEILINTPVIAECIRKGEIYTIKEYMGRKDGLGMQTMDQSLYKLYEDDLISESEALQNADSSNNLRILMKIKDHDNKSKRKFVRKKDNGNSSMDLE